MSEKDSVKFLKDELVRLALLKEDADKLLQKAYAKSVAIEGERRLVVYRLALASERELKDE